jgi:8-amino-7-oxononanoate synthase
MGFWEEELKRIKEEGLYRSLRPMTSPQGSEIEIDGRKVLNFCSNNYLGLAGDPRLNAAAIEAVRKYGSGSGAARLIVGNHELHEELETALAGWKGAEAALLFNSGYHANIGAIPALAGEGDIIFSDELNHASLIDGCRLSKAEKVIFRHNDLSHLEELLKNSLSHHGGEGRVRGRLIVTEAVFSMEGDLCPLDDLLKLADRYDTMVYLDEAHAVGVFGENGEGLAQGVRHRSNRLICMGTLGKAFGSYGAFLSGPRALRDYLINKARSFIFTTALPPAAVGASLAALKIVQGEPERRARLWENVRRVGAYGPTPLRSPILSIKIGPPDRTMEISRKLFEEGIYVQGIRPPTVPEGTSRLRLTVMATHTEGHLKRLAECLKTI